METIVMAPAAGRKKADVIRFLDRLSLSFDPKVQVTVLLEEDGELLATGSRDKNLLKCIGVSPERRGEGLAAAVMTVLVQDAIAAGFSHLFLFTTPSNQELFSGLGFYPVAATGDVLLMENQKNGVRDFVASFAVPDTKSITGAIVANANPFTNGHLYLVETAAGQCGTVHLFILSEEQSTFPFEVRMELAQKAAARFPNVFVHPTGEYLISSATFPNYFLKDKSRTEEVNCALDLEVFCKCFAKPLHITRRYVGEEPFCPVTACYNQALRETLPGNGIELITIPRREENGLAVSASQVRRLLAEGKLEEIRPLVPEPTFSYLASLKNFPERNPL